MNYYIVALKTSERLSFRWSRNPSRRVLCRMMSSGWYSELKFFKGRVMLKTDKFSYEWQLIKYFILLENGKGRGQTVGHNFVQNCTTFKLSIFILFNFSKCILLFAFNTKYRETASQHFVRFPSCYALVLAASVKIVRLESDRLNWLNKLFEWRKRLK